MERKTQQVVAKFEVVKWYLHWWNEEVFVVGPYSYTIYRTSGRYYVEASHSAEPQELGYFLQMGGFVVKKLLNRLNVTRLEPLNNAQVRIVYNNPEEPKHRIVVSGGELDGLEIPY